MATYFSDGLKGVSVLNGVARLEFHRLEPVEHAANREMRTVSELIVALPLQGLAHAFGMLEQVRDQLIKEGVLKPGPAAAAEPATPISRERSPNFP